MGSTILPFNSPTGSASAAPDPRINCEWPHERERDYEPISAGPLALQAVYCQGVQRGPAIYTYGGASVSPDGRFVAVHQVYGDGGLWIAPLARNFLWTRVDADAGSHSTFSNDFGPNWAFGWGADSRSVWTATQEKLRPSGFAVGPKRPIEAVHDGRVRELPEITHPAGPLDALFWVGADGLAVAQFGTRGGYYRPERDDPTPTFGVIDARRGLVLDTLPFDAIEGLQDSRRYKNSRGGFVWNTVATVLEDGRVRALMSVPGQWAIWTQGERPRTLPDPYGRKSSMVLSPDGSSVLVFPDLRTDGALITRGGYVPGRPVEGVLAALHDLETGQARWTIRTRITRDQGFPKPAVSPDGRYALVGLLPTETRGRVALVSMENGGIVQELTDFGGGGMGFTNDGQAVWMVGHGATVLYRIASEPK